MQRHPDGSQAVTETELTAEIVLVPLTGTANQRKSSDSLQPPSVSRDADKCGGAQQRKDSRSGSTELGGRNGFQENSSVFM